MAGIGQQVKDVIDEIRQLRFMLKCGQIAAEESAHPEEIEHLRLKLQYWKAQIGKRVEKIRMLQRIQAADGSLLSWRGMRLKLYVEQGRICACCGATPEDGAMMTLDHIKPRSRYPELSRDPDNLQVLCAECNRLKGDRHETDYRRPPVLLLPAPAQYPQTSRQSEEAHAVSVD